MRQNVGARATQRRAAYRLVAILATITITASACLDDDEPTVEPPVLPIDVADESDADDPETSVEIGPIEVTPLDPPPADPVPDEDAPAPEDSESEDVESENVETYGPGVIPDEFALDGDPVAWRANTASVSAMFEDVYADSGLSILMVEGDVVLTLGGGLMAIDYSGVTITFVEEAAIPNVVIDGTLVGTVESNGPVVSFTGEEGSLTGTTTVLGDVIILPIDAEDLPLGTTDFTFEFDTSGDRLVIRPVGGAENTVWFPVIWLRQYE